ncbi:MAG: ABC transporter permease [Bifidobacterium sp.]|nr:ABC transporter permease [Bifidobacterium sp.]
MGRHQHAESAGLVSFLCCALIGGIAMTLYVQLAPAIWQVSRRLFSVFSGIVAACGVVSFIVAYAGKSRSLKDRHGWFIVVRRIIEILALSTVYAATLFLVSFSALGVINQMMGRAFIGYMAALCAGSAGLCGYVTFVQASLMDSKTLASLLPFFVVSGVSAAGLTSDDPYWYNNNFSQLGDRMTFAARMFNSTLILAGFCIVIISYFSISELVTTYRMRSLWPDGHGPGQAEEITHFKTRIACLAVLLTLSGIAFVGIGLFRYTPHPVVHNVFARGLPGIMAALLIGLPWIAPQLSRAIYAVSDLAIAVCIIEFIAWLRGANTLTNVEALAGLLFLGWFIVFSRQIAAIEADRVQTQMLHHQAGNVLAGNVLAGTDLSESNPESPAKPTATQSSEGDVRVPPNELESRLSANR